MNQSEKEEYALALAEGSILKKKYRIRKVLGEGGFGITYLAEDMQSKAMRAVKEYVPLGICYRRDHSAYLAPTSADKWQAYEHGRLRFMEEGQVLMELRHIKAVVDIFDAFEENGTAYYVMEYLDGMTVRQLQKQLPDKRLKLADAMEIVLTVGIGLDQVHRERKLLHRDISPDNIFFTVNREIKLIDFGSAKHLSQRKKNVFSVVLKPGYAPPEQYSSTEEQGFYTDEYALAGTFYRMATGAVPPDSMERKAGKELVPMTSIKPDIPAAVWNVVRRAMELKPVDRYATVMDFIAALDRAYRNVAGQTPVTARTNPDRQETIRSDRSVSDTGQRNLTGSGRQPSPSGHASVSRKTVQGKGIPYLLIYTDGGGNQKVPFPPDTDIKIGRARDCQVVLPSSQKISKVHCILRFDSGKGDFLLADRSTNGTLADNAKLKRDTLYRVREGCILTLAGVIGIQVGVEYGQ